MKTVFTAGCATLDALVYVNEFFDKTPQTIFSKRYYETIGGTGSGKALALARLFDNVTFHCLLGNDPDGKNIKKQLLQHHLHLLYDVDPLGTEKHINIMNDHGQRISLYVKYATFEPEIRVSPLERAIKHADYIVLNIINYCRRLIPVAQKYYKEIWCDIHDFDGNNPYHKDFIDGADYIFMSSDLMNGYRGFMMQLIDRGKKVVVCTHGENGSTLLDIRRKFIDLPILRAYKRVDTNGAGDNFMSGFLYAWSKGYPPEICQKYATIAAGLCIMSPEITHELLSPAVLEQEFSRYFE